MSNIRAVSFPGMNPCCYNYILFRRFCPNIIRDGDKGYVNPSQALGENLVIKDFEFFIAPISYQVQPLLICNDGH